MAKVARALICFVDNSFLYAELSKKPEAQDNMIQCFKIVGLPEGAPSDKPTMASNIVRTAGAGNCLEMDIPISRVSCVSIQEEYLGKDVPDDMKALWK